MLRAGRYPGTGIIQFLERGSDQCVKHACAAAAILLLGACSSPPVVSGDLSCERFRHVSASIEQIKFIEANYAIMETWATQIAAHNTEYDRDCLPKVKK